MADATIKNIPQNRALGTLAEWLMSAKNKTGTIGEFLLGQAPETLANMSYGFYPTQGTGQTFGLKPESLDVAGLIPTGLLGGLAAKTYANLAGKELARNIAQQTSFGQIIDPRMNMIAYHGSPHSFDEFSMSKIGTGEGAQAYGHGLYFSDSPAVAKEYQKALSGDFDVAYKGKKLKGGDSLSNAVRILYKNIDNGMPFEEAKAHALSTIQNVPWEKENIEAMKSLLPSDISKVDAGSLYKVDIADEAIPNMLLWDKPLSEQPEAVKQALQNLKLYNANNEQSLLDISNKTLDLVNRGKGGTPEWSNLHAMRRKLQGNGLSPDASGADVYKALTELKKGADNKASNALLNQGIQGIRYLDAGSRGKGAGTMNTVVFDDKLVKILEKNGKPIKARSTK